MSKKMSIQDLNVKGNKVLMRVDFNVPLDKQGRITDDSRIKAALPSIRYVLDQGGALILMSHLGRPKNKKVPELSLAPCAKRLSELLGVPVIMAPDCVDQEVESLVRNLQPGQVLLLENLRFHKGEEHPEEDEAFVKNLAKLGTVYVNDAFGTAHRYHASTAAIAKYFPEKAAAGFLMEKEMTFLNELLKNPKKPFHALIGGAKISTKMGVIQALVPKIDALYIGGAMAYTFFKALNIPIGNSLYEEDFVQKAQDIMEACKAKGLPLYLPLDIVVTQKVEAGAPSKVVDVTSPLGGIPNEWEGVDIGPKTIDYFVKHLKEAKTIFWNGPVGVFEVPEFAQGTFEIAKALSQLKALTIVGGGDSVAALQTLGLSEKMTHISTGGGASLEYLELGTLPGIEALSDKTI